MRQRLQRLERDAAVPPERRDGGDIHPPQIQLARHTRKGTLPALPPALGQGPEAPSPLPVGFHVLARIVPQNRDDRCPDSERPALPPKADVSRHGSSRRTGTFRAGRRTPMGESEELAEDGSAERLEERAERQYGLFTLAQALTCGLNRTTVYRRAARGRYVLEQPGVFSFAGLPESWERSVLAACLAAGKGAVASHRTAARIWGLVEPRDDIVEIVVPRNRLPRTRRTTVHRSTDLIADHTTVRKRIPVTNPLRTIVDLGAVLSAEKVEDALDTGLAPAVVVLDRGHRVDAERGRRTGAQRMRRAGPDSRRTGARGRGQRLAARARMARLLRRPGCRRRSFITSSPRPGGVFLAEVDFAYPEIRLVIEVDGFGVHGTPRSDVERFRAAERARAVWVACAAVHVATGRAGAGDGGPYHRRSLAGLAAA